MSGKNGKLSFFPMFASILAGMFGSGVYDISYQLGVVASPGGAIIAWLICFMGMYLFSLSLMNLLDKEPDGDGIYVYANKFGGSICEFMSGWGYWISGWIGNIAFATMMMIALGTFFPVLGDTGVSWLSILVASAVMWGIYALIVQGAEFAMSINSIITVVKIIPVVIFFVVVVTAFKFEVFTANFWTNFAGNIENLGSGFNSESVFNQVTDSMLSIIWLFMGVESAALLSRHAESKEVASKATVVGLTVGSVLMFLVSLLPYGVMPAEEFVALGEPSIGKLLVEFIGPIGASFIEGAIILSIFGSWISYTLMPVESIMVLSEDKLLPSSWGEKNDKGVAQKSLFLTTVLSELLLISMHFTDNAYNFGFSLSGSAILVTWVFITMYQLKRSIKDKNDPHRVRNIVIGLAGTIYLLYAMFVSGLTYILLLGVVFSIGFVFYYRGQKEHGVEKVFSNKDKIFVSLVVLGGIIGLVMFFS